MTNLEKLLNGIEVEWKPLGEVATIYGGLTGKSKDDFIDGNAFYISYKNIYDNIDVNCKKLEKVKVSDSERQNAVHYGDILFTGSSETADDVGMSSVISEKFDKPVYLNSFSFGIRFNHNLKLIPEFSKYLFRCHFMRIAIAKTASGVTRYNVSKARFKKILIPFPPISIQKEIAGILDKFTKLEAELEAELDCRKRQYDYYRNKLLYSDLSIVNPKTTDITYKTVGDIFDIRNGYTPSKANMDYWMEGSIPWFRMEDIRTNGSILNDSIQHITPHAIKGKGLFKANSIILATTATIGVHALLKVDSLANQRFTNFSVREALKDSILPEFLYYYFFVIDEWCKQNVYISSFPSVDMEKLNKQLVPIPSLSEQRRIVSILSKFDKLTTSISEGLPREIELRRKQYEYYRNKLLSFTNTKITQ